MNDVAEKQESKVRRAFLAPLMRQFRVPDTVDDKQVKAFLADYETALDKFSNEALREAANQITVNRMTRTLPTIAECHRACQDAQNELLSQTYEPKVSDHPESSARLNLADKLIVCELGRRACDEGWQAGLWGFIRREGRLPDPREAEGVKRQSLGDQAWIRNAMEEARGTPSFQRLYRAHEAMEKRKSDILERVYDGVYVR